MQESFIRFLFMNLLITITTGLVCHLYLLTRQMMSFLEVFNRSFNTMTYNIKHMQYDIKELLFLILKIHFQANAVQ
ncbi:hypothetical protein CLV62_1432 [Dysgonomonas alginatilytica]|uniref:Uncharacterized protein n=1 Tax=Dysgonomonas alginatilytica TaxID=1605892 RepID=A0A2V3PHT3_9BACT|nr:hypothetical protein CLV62_1432 [Dysgonomonas alginatilytica]